jgi:DMSO/TMAO reductase YedYZ molybdopterin-dependent catalytic subunit
MTPPDLSPAEIRGRTRRAFAVWAAGLAAGGGAYAWIRSRGRDGGALWPLRRVLRANESLATGLGAPAGTAPEFPAERSGTPKPNGHHGEPDRAPTQLRVSWPGGGETASLGELLAGLPRVESATELKCIEGWSQIVTWGGVSFATVAAARRWPAEAFAYAQLRTADGEYYVGMDRASLLHSQTLLCDRMNGSPLAADHGGPLRLVAPVKYGIKQIKWLAEVEFTAERPADYWAEQGYDWFAGL